MYNEVKQDLFTVPQDYALAHCISADFALGAGIAKVFRDKYGTKQELLERCPNYHYHGGDCIGTGTRDTRAVFNLITKAHFWQKPTYESLREALIEMKIIAVLSGYKKIAMPHIGCGLDRLEWSKVRNIIQEVFHDDGIEILICSVR